MMSGEVQLALLPPAKR